MKVPSHSLVLLLLFSILIQNAEAKVHTKRGSTLSDRKQRSSLENEITKVSVVDSSMKTLDSHINDIREKVNIQGTHIQKLGNDMQGLKKLLGEWNVKGDIVGAIPGNCSSTPFLTLLNFLSRRFDAVGETSIKCSLHVSNLASEVNRIYQGLSKNMLYLNEKLTTSILDLNKKLIQSQRTMEEKLSKSLDAMSTAFGKQFGYYLGCYLDSRDRILENYIESSHEMMTQSRCRKLCWSGHYRYYGLQSGYACFCGNNFIATRMPESECNSPCTGDNITLCGGPWRMAVYKYIL